MSKWIIDINDRWLIHDVFEREEPDDELVIRYFNSIYGVKGVERFEEVEDVPEEKEKKYEVGDVYRTDNGNCVIITNTDNGFISCISKTGAIDIVDIERDTDLIDMKFQEFQGKMLISEFFKDIEKIDL